MDSFIPEPHASYARRVCESVHAGNSSLRDRLAAATSLPTSYATRLVEDPNIVCVAGARGSGKTTVLAAATGQLASEGHVVVPPIRPEYFMASASLLTTAVAHLQTTVRVDWMSNEEDDDRVRHVLVAIERALRKANLIIYGRGDSPLLRADEQAADASLAAEADSNFLETWRNLTEEVREMAAARRPTEPKPLIIIPVDDPDLAPEMLRQIILDLRLMTCVEGVVGITCLDPEETRALLEDAYTGSYRTAPSPLLTARVVDAQIAKAFPDDRYVHVAGLDREQTLSFTALDLPLPSIEQTCADHAVGKDFGTDTIASIFRMPGDGDASPYAAALPSNPRDLRALAYGLSTISAGDDDGSRKAAMILCKSAIANALRQSGVVDASRWPSGLPFEPNGELLNGVPSCNLRFDDLALQSSGGVAKSMPGGPESAVRVEISHYSALEASLVKRGQEKQETIQRLDPALAYAVLLVREFSHYYDLIHANITGSVPMRGGERSSHYFRVVIDDVRTDNRFVNPPAWEAYFDYFLLDEALTGLIQIAPEEFESDDYRYAIEAYVLDFCNNVTSIQDRRAIEPDPIRVSKAIRSVGPEERAVLVEAEIADLFSRFDLVLDRERESHRADSVRALDFRRWVEVSLIQMCHPKLLRPAFIEQFLSEREALLRRRDLLEQANSTVASVLDRRIKGALDEAWISPFIELLGRFDVASATILAASHQRALEAVERSRHRLLGETALVAEQDDVAELAPPSEGDSDFEIAMAFLDRLEEETDSSSRMDG